MLGHGAEVRILEAELRRRGLGKAAAGRLASGEARARASEQLETLPEGQRLLWRGHPEWPRRLEGLPGAPLVLWIRGRIDWLSRVPVLAVVGTRHPTPYGVHATRAFVEALAIAGLGIASGLARGVDGIAHEAAEMTVAVLGSGLACIYPRENGPLAERIVSGGGCLLSEYPPRYRAHPGTFPRRNRIIAGLSEGVLVIEAGRRSGALITAEWGNSYGRSVWAVPGPFASPNSRGCHDLIRDGALLAESPEGVLEDLGLSSLPVQEDTVLDSAIEAGILRSLRQGPKPVDALVTELGLELGKILLGLQRLESRNLAECRAGGIYFPCTRRRG
ncbi:MAG: DNA-processing protein DprA, partial [Planctomycetota bacterium]